MSRNTGSVLSAVFRNRLNGILAGLLFVFLAVFIGITVYVNALANRDDQYLEHAGELRVLSQEVAKNAVDARPSSNCVLPVTTSSSAGVTCPKVMPKRACRPPSWMPCRTYRRCGIR